MQSAFSSVYAAFPQIYISRNLRLVFKSFDSLDVCAPYPKGNELEALDAMTAAINSEGNTTAPARWLRAANFAAERLSQKHGNAKEYSEVLQELIKTTV